MKVEITRLANGFTIASDAIPHLETVAVGVWIDVGARHETKAQNGISHLIEHMAFKGTATRSARAIAEEIENKGGFLNAYTGRDQTCFHARVLKDDLGLASGIIADIIRNALIDEEELKREKSVVLQEIGQAADTPDDIIFDHLQTVAFPDQPIGRPVLGSPRTVRALSRKSLNSYLRQWYVPSRMTFIASGAVTHAQAVDLATQAFGDMKPGKPPRMVPARYHGGEYRSAQKLEQAHLAFGVEGIPGKSAKTPAAQVFSLLFGGGMSSRLFQELREKRGLCYEIHSFAGFHADTGFMGVYAGTSAGKLGQLMPLVLGELESVATSANDEEVARAKAQMRSSLAMGLESPMARCELIASHLFTFGRVLTPREMRARLDAVTVTDVRRFASSLLKNGKPSVAALGPVRSLESYDRLSARFG